MVNQAIYSVYTKYIQYHNNTEPMPHGYANSSINHKEPQLYFVSPRERLLRQRVFQAKTLIVTCTLRNIFSSHVLKRKTELSLCGFFMHDFGIKMFYKHCVKHCSN